MYGAVLAKWERASGDFKSAAELNSADADARHNAEVLDRLIAKLVDSLHEMQQCSNGMCDKGQQLGDALKKLKGRIPAPNMPPGAAGDDDEEDEDQPLGPQPGQEEGPSKEGKEMTLSPEQAGWLLDAYRLDSERRLPMGQGPAAEPKDRSRPPGDPRTQCAQLTITAQAFGLWTFGLRTFGLRTLALISLPSGLLATAPLPAQPPTPAPVALLRRGTRSCPS